MSSASQAPSPPQAPYPYPKPRRRTGATVAIAVVVLILVIAVVSFAYLRSGADLRINLYSTHLLTSVSYTLSVDGSVVDSGTLDPVESMNYTTTYHWWFSDNATILISAVSTGGLLGSITDTETLEVLDGGSYTVNLFI